MHSITHDVLLMMVMLNPFATMLFLTELINERTEREFSNIFSKASIFTFAILLLFAMTGDFVLSVIFQVSLPAVRIFGGIIIFMVAFSYIMKGPEGIKLFRGNLTEIAQKITLPFMVGPGTIWVAIDIGVRQNVAIASTVFLIALAINAIIMLTYMMVIKHSSGPVTTRLLSYFQMLMRVNALLIGAVSIEMILTGIKSAMM